MAGSYACRRYGLIIWKIRGIFMGKVGLSNNTMALLLYVEQEWLWHASDSRSCFLNLPNLVSAMCCKLQQMVSGNIMKTKPHNP